MYSSIIDNKIYAYVVFGNKIHYASLNNIIKNFPNNVPHRLETIIGKSLDTCKIMVDGIEYIIKESASSTLDGDSMAYLQPDRACSLIEIYQDDTLLHKWDFEGSTSAERLSDKAETENKISIVMGDGSEFIPV